MRVRRLMATVGEAAVALVLVGGLIAPASAAPKKHWNLYQDRLGAYVCTTGDPRGQTLVAHPFGNQAACLATLETPPVIDVTVTPSDPDGDHGWYQSNVRIDWKVTDAPGVLPAYLELTGCVDKVIDADQPETAETCEATSVGGSASDSVSIKRDGTPPSITWDSQIANGDSFEVGSVPDEPTCSATDAMSGPGDCTITGYGKGIGTHTLEATAFDLAGNKTVEQRGYTVTAHQAQVDPPTAVDQTCNGPGVVVAGGIDIPNVPGVDYFIDSEPVAVGFVELYPGTYQVTAKAQADYDLVGYPDGGWSRTVAAADCIVPAQVTEPSVTNETCASPGNVTLGRISFVASDGLDYFINGEMVTSGFIVLEPGIFAVTAVARDGYVLAAYPEGGWSLEVLGASPVGCIYHVTAAAPSATDETADASGGITIPLSEGVDYFIDGTPADKGFHALAPGQHEVTAEPQFGYVLDGDINWFLTINKYLMPVTPEAPSKTDQACGGPGVVVQGSITIPDVTGVQYLLDGNPMNGGSIGLPPGDYTVTAEAMPDYELTGYEGGWTLTIAGHGSDTQCYVPYVPPSPSDTDESCDGPTVVAGSLDIPNAEHASYYLSPGWQYLAPGSHQKPAGTYTVLAMLDPGYLQVSGLVWNLTIAPASCLIPVTAPNPTMTPASCGGPSAILHVPDVEGVQYLDYPSGSPLAPGDYTMSWPWYTPVSWSGTAVAKSGYVLEGDPVHWQARADAPSCPVTAPDPTVVHETCGAGGGVDVPTWPQGVVYYAQGTRDGLNTSVVAGPGFVPFDPGQVRVWAEAQLGYSLTGTAEWYLPITAKGSCTVTVPELDWTLAGACPALRANLTVPDIEGVTYSYQSYWNPDNWITLNPGPHSFWGPWSGGYNGVYTLRAKAWPGYTILGESDGEVVWDKFVPGCPLPPTATDQTCDASGFITIPNHWEDLTYFIDGEVTNPPQRMTTYQVPLDPGTYQVTVQSSNGHLTDYPEGGWSLTIAPKSGCLIPVTIPTGPVFVQHSPRLDGFVLVDDLPGVRFFSGTTTITDGEDGLDQAYSPLAWHEGGTVVIEAEAKPGYAIEGGYPEGGWSFTFVAQTYDTTPMLPTLTCNWASGGFYIPNESPWVSYYSEDGTTPEGGFEHGISQPREPGTYTIIAKTTPGWPGYVLVDDGPGGWTVESPGVLSIQLVVTSDCVSTEGAFAVNIGTNNDGLGQYVAGGGLTAFVSVAVNGSGVLWDIPVNDGGFMEWADPGAFAPGDTVQAIGGDGFYKELVVADLSVDVINGATGYVEGTCTTGMDVALEYSTDETHPNPTQLTVPCINGSFTGNFAPNELPNYPEGSFVEARQFDVDGDLTQVDKWYGEYDLGVTPTAPVVTDETCTASGTIDLPDTPGVQYYIDWSPDSGLVERSTGPHLITAEAKPGYVLVDYPESGWLVEIHSPTGCTATPEAPTTTAQPCGYPNGTIILPYVRGVDYLIVNVGGSSTGMQIEVEPGTYTVLASPLPGYTLEGQSEWQVTVEGCVIEVVAQGR